MCFKRAEWLTSLRSAWNGWQFAWRNRLPGDRGLYEEPAEPKDGILIPPELQDYDLGRLIERGSRERLLETLAYLEWLDTAVRQAPAEFGRAFAMPDFNWLDAGAKNWAYVEAIDAFIRQHRAAPAPMDGVELDPHRRYRDLHTREEYARAFIRDLPHVSYHADDLLHWKKPAAIISHFLPFVFEEPLLRWGLPMSAFQPRVILDHTLELLKPGGLLLIVNQGPAEAEAQEKLLAAAADRLPIRYQNLGQLPARFIEYQYPRFGWLCIRNGNHEQPH